MRCILDLEIAAGEFVVVAGVSGAGKSTLIRAVNGLVPLTAGSLTVETADGQGGTRAHEVIGLQGHGLRDLR